MPREEWSGIRQSQQAETDDQTVAADNQTKVKIWSKYGLIDDFGSEDDMGDL